MSETLSHEELVKLWDTNRPEFIKLYAKEHQKPLTHAKLDKAFVDADGKQIYQFPAGVYLPINRFGKKKEFLQWLSKGLTDEEDEMFDEARAEIVFNATNLIDMKTRYGGVLAEKKKRKAMIIHTEIFYNLVALELVREDENPEVFDNDIHMEKIRAFKKMTREGSTYFFFQKTALPALSTYLNFTQTEWENYWSESLISQQSLPEILKVFTSVITSTNQQKNSQNN